MTPLIPLTAIVLTFNEEANLPDCLASLSGWVQALFVVDSGSSDRTLEIARQHGATIVAHPFETHTKQWAWALATLPIESEWVMGLDADQRVTAALREELIRLFSEEPHRLEGIQGLYLNRRHIFRGRWLRYGGLYPKHLLKLFRRNSVRLSEADLVDHHFYVDGHTLALAHDIIEENRKENDIAFWIDKHNRYAKRQAQEELLRRLGRAGLFPPGSWAPRTSA